MFSGQPGQCWTWLIKSAAMSLAPIFSIHFHVYQRQHCFPAESGIIIQLVQQRVLCLSCYSIIEAFGTAIKSVY